jgi:nicotinamidase-related amidase
LAIPARAARGSAGSIELPLRSRDPNTGQPRVETLKLDPARIGIIVMDMWNYHWCMTAAERAAAIVPRLNRALDGARELGMTVIFTPSSGTATLEDTPQRMAAMGFPDSPFRELTNVPSPPCSLPQLYPCKCGPGIECPVNYGSDGMMPGLRVEPGDYIAWGTREVNNLMQARGLTHLIYTGIHLDICVLGKSEGMIPMSRLGYQCVLARDMTDAHSYPPQDALDYAVEQIERHLAPSLELIEVLRRCGQWDETWAVDLVQLRPWGRPMRPYTFEKTATIHLEQPRLHEAEFRYTLDGSVPTAISPLYTAPIVVDQTATLNVQAFRRGQPVGLPSQGCYVRLPPDPPAPTLRLWELDPLSVSLSDQASEWRVAYRNWGFQMRGQTYLCGITLHAPGSIVFACKPDYQRFVALAGADDGPMGKLKAQGLAQYPSMRFQVYIDDKLAAESPVMRLLQKPWPFDVPIPTGARRLKLVVDDAGDGNRLDVGCWAKAGFVSPGYKGPRVLY